MTEYQVFGLVFFGTLALVIIVLLIVDGVCKRRNKRVLQKAKKTYSRMKKVENVAVFTALATAYGKDDKAQQSERKPLNRTNDKHCCRTR